jgi:hypothetical protein
MTLISKLSQSVINKVLEEFKSKNNQKKINDEVIKPLINQITKCIRNEFFPFIIIGISIFFLTFIFSLIIMILVAKKL